MHASAVVLSAMITFPVVPLMLVVPVKSGVIAVPVAEDARPTSAYCPARSDPLRVAATEKLPVPVALAYWTLLPARLIVDAVGLKIST